MAEQVAVLKQLEEQLNCSICLDTYTDPKLLQCFHVYCRQCLVPLVDRDQQGQLGLTCPTCRQVTPIPDRGVAGLQPAFHINNLLQIKDSFQKVESPAANLEGAAYTESDVNPMKICHCSVHEGKELELYCETCGELICTRCALKGGRHRDHCYEEIKEAYEKYKVEITSSQEPMEKQLTYIKRALVLLDARCGEISDQRAATAGNIHITFRRLREVLNVRETELISQLDQLTQGKLKDLAVQRDQIETTLAQLNSCLHFMRESLRTGNERDVLMMKANIVAQVKELTTPFQPDTLEPNTEADIIFSTLADMATKCQKYGQVFAPGLPDPDKCRVTKGVEAAAAVGKRSTATLQATNFVGKPCEEPIRSLECIFVSEITHQRSSCSVERSGQSLYEISYQPIIKGRHQLHVKVQGQHVRGSPFSVAVKSPLEKLGTPILIIGGVVEPWGVAVNQRGEVVVTEWGGHCVSVFSPSGEKLLSFGNYGSGQGQLKYPRGVAVTAEGNILVVDSENGRIQKFGLDGQFIGESMDIGAWAHFSHPIDITVSVSNKVYVVDTCNHRIVVLNSDLHTTSTTFGRRGSGRGQLLHPGCVAYDSTGKVYVADTQNGRVQVFTAEGKFVRMCTCPLLAPVGVAIDTDDNLYVSEGYDNQISVFTSAGQFVTSFGRQGDGPGEFVSPRGVAVDNSGVVYVCDRKNDRVQVF